MSGRLLTRALAVTAAALAAGTVGIGALGATTLAAEPTHQVSIQLDPDLPYNISEQTVQAAAQNVPLSAWTPMTLRVTTDHLTYDQRRGNWDGGEDAVLSIPQQEPADPDAEARFDGAAIRADALPPGTDLRDRSYDVDRSFTRNRDLGHGPSAVVAAARTLGEASYTGPPRSPEFWLGLVLGGAALTVLTLIWWARRRLTGSALRRSFRAGRLDLARVILDHDALEVSYQTVPEDARPPGFTQAWEALAKDALPLARQEQDLERRLDSTDHDPALTADVAAFREQTRTLAATARALELSGQVHGGLAGGTGVLDQVGAPLITASRTVLARLRTAPAGAVQDKTAEQLSTAHEDLLRLTQVWGSTVDQRTEAPVELQKEWRAAERRLGAAASKVILEIARFPSVPSSGPSVRREAPDQTALRTSLGLSASPAGNAWEKLVQADGALLEFLGPDPELDRVLDDRGNGRGSGTKAKVEVPRERTSPSAWDRFLRTRESGRLGLTWLGWASVAGLIGMLTAIPALVTAEAITARPGWELTGDQEVDSVVIDGPAVDDLEVDRILRFVDGAFTEPIDVTVAVRRAESYVRPDGDRNEYSLDVAPEATIAGLWRLKNEFPDKVNPVTGELLPGTVIVPVMVWEGGQTGVMYPMTGAVSFGEASRLGPHAYERANVRASDGLTAVSVGSALESVGRGLQSNGERVSDISEEALAWSLWAALTAGVLSLVALAEIVAGLSVGLGRLGRGSAELRSTKRRLERLMLGLDESQLSAVAVLGAGPAGSPQEAEQRLYESALVAAWRDVEAIEALPLAERSTRETRDRIRQLQASVDQIDVRETDVRARADAALRSARVE